jgi:uracil-DNA glycosylase
VTQTRSPLADSGGVESLLSFWADAGIDLCLEAEPVNRLTETAQMMRAPAPPPPLRVAPTAKGPAAINSAALEAAAEKAKGLAASAFSLEDLSAAIIGFDDCPLRRDSANQPVLWRGKPGAPVLTLGEAPTPDDHAAGAPFSGIEGRLLDRMMDAVGLADQCLIMNSVFWHPPGGRAPTPAEQKVCLPFIERAIQLSPPKALLLIGAACARGLLGREEGVLALHGRWQDWQSSDGATTLPAMVTLTPAFLLQQPSAKKKSWNDLLTFAERVG